MSFGEHIYVCFFVGIYLEVELLYYAVNFLFLVTKTVNFLFLVTKKRFWAGVGECKIQIVK